MALWASAKLKHLKRTRRALSKEASTGKDGGGGEKCRYFDVKLEALRNGCEPPSEAFEPSSARGMTYHESEKLVERIKRATSIWRERGEAPIVVNKALVDRLIVDNLAHHLAMAAGDVEEPVSGYRAVNTGRGRMDLTADRLKHAAGSLFLGSRQRSGAAHRNYDIISLFAEAMTEQQDLMRAMEGHARDVRGLMQPGDSWKAMCFDARACIHDSRDTMETFNRLFES